MVEAAVKLNEASYFLTVAQSISSLLSWCTLCKSSNSHSASQITCIWDTHLGCHLSSDDHARDIKWKWSSPLATVGVSRGRRGARRRGGQQAHCSEAGDSAAHASRRTVLIGRAAG